MDIYIFCLITVFVFLYSLTHKFCSFIIKSLSFEPFFVSLSERTVM